MTPLYSDEEYAKAKSEDKLSLKCEHCGSAFLKRKAYITAFLSGDNRTPNKFCSRACGNTAKRNGISCICENCGIQFEKPPCELKVGRRNFCSKSCRATCLNKGRTQSEETRRKIGDSNRHRKRDRKPDIEKVCPTCELRFAVPYGRRKTNYCSRACVAENAEVRGKISKAVKQRIEAGTHKGWASRDKLSYPEKFFLKVFENNGITEFQREKKVDKYFIDFAFSDQRLALEIDGKQHELPERKASDELKDQTLASMGWRVHRIKWQSINNPEGSAAMKEEIDRLLSLLHVS